MTILSFAPRPVPLDDRIREAQRDIESDDPWLASKATDFLMQDTTRARLRQMTEEQER